MRKHGDLLMACLRGQIAECKRRIVWAGIRHEKATVAPYGLLLFSMVFPFTKGEPYLLRIHHRIRDYKVKKLVEVQSSAFEIYCRKLQIDCPSFRT